MHACRPLHGSIAMATGVWVIICAMTPILQREDGGMEELRGEEAGMKAEPAKQRREGGGGAAEQSSRDPDRNKKEKENRFSFCWQQGKNLFVFSYNEENSLGKKWRENASLRKKCYRVGQMNNGGRMRRKLTLYLLDNREWEGEHKDFHDSERTISWTMLVVVGLKMQRLSWRWCQR